MGTTSLWFASANWLLFICTSFLYRNTSILRDGTPKSSPVLICSINTDGSSLIIWCNREIGREFSAVYRINRYGTNMSHDWWILPTQTSFDKLKYELSGKTNIFETVYIFQNIITVGELNKTFDTGSWLAAGLLEGAHRRPVTLRDARQSTYQHREW